MGHVSRHDRVFDFLCSVVSERMGVREAHPTFRVFRRSGSNEDAYKEKSSRARIIGKFYGSQFGWDQDKAAAAARR